MSYTIKKIILYYLFILARYIFFSDLKLLTDLSVLIPNCLDTI